MRHARVVTGIFTALALMASVLPARAEVSTVNVTIQYGIGYLPLYVMRHDHLLEKHLQQEGLHSKVTWSQIGTGSVVNDALLSGRTAFAGGGPPQMLTLWDRTQSNLKVKGIAALSSMPMFLNANQPRLKSLDDFTSSDRIAVASAGSSIETLILQMAAAKRYGAANFRKFDPLMVNLAHPDGMTALLSKSYITAQFTAPPYQYEELTHPGIHRMLSSYDVTGGPATFLMVWTTTRFRDENPKTVKAYYDALTEATDFINAHKRQAAAIYVQDEKGSGSADDVLKMLNDPDVHVTMVPQHIMDYAKTMYRLGTIKHMPTSWKDLFFPEVYGLPGS
ncbi:ABC transporter substrate-binding protein [Pandoraea sp.]|uniref:ABC transporter substrate-binding protein n=1 Tax=Pandoraea sp. TaxID=1883445 RepID=UPI001216F396|nr:ABC transporter substrate-binding protein [Pandoraea sp.]TAL56442.1 MAG: ABC transporter substrate-binding protein [Pandoraea sp.]TAM15261.1 MAG: ABC transporter substrate-binding protein [Pandoraea sp.]